MPQSNEIINKITSKIESNKNHFSFIDEKYHKARLLGHLQSIKRKNITRTYHYIGGGRGGTNGTIASGATLSTTSAASSSTFSHVAALISISSPSSKNSTLNLEALKV